ncbi:hypothetical protein PV327_011360 [Microctonus hyperodae]|uniref:Uncharacterized protein n=1 Tax=Microctonus hyperodae TaxID=165561 RepID=A0AA39C3X4_MICHY|nr:hypothetical protein PV327_011360 [Microctonus hyperodae]
MSSAFILDYMHLACVGVMKKILELPMYGPRNVRLSAINKLDIPQATASSVMIHGKVWRSMRCIYEFSKKSSVVDAWEIDMTVPLGDATVSVLNIMRKMIMMKVLNKKSGSNEVFVLSLLHT